MKAEGTGAYAGRRIPMEAFYAMLQEILFWLITDVDQQVLRQLVAVNFGPQLEYEIVPFGLVTPSQEEQQQQAGAQQAPPPQGMEMSLDTMLEQPRYNVQIVSDTPPVEYRVKYGAAT